MLRRGPARGPHKVATKSPPEYTNDGGFVPDPTEFVMRRCLSALSAGGVLHGLNADLLAFVHDQLKIASGARSEESDVAQDSKTTARY
jgi:hypothetical protein